MKTATITSRAAFLSTLAAVAQTADARPTAPAVFCEVYPTANRCQGTVVACTTCHTSAPELNLYGGSIAAALDRSSEFELSLPKALAQTESEDADGDGRSNAHELAEGTWPGSASSLFLGEPAVPELESSEFAFRRVSVAFCGQSPTFAEMDALRVAPDKSAILHAKLDTCLKTDYWRKEVLVHIADPLIRAVPLLGSCGQTFLDFEPDYHLFLWAMTDGHDASEMLTAQYFVERSESGELRKVDDIPIERTRAGVKCTNLLGPGTIPQNVAPPYRAGVLTTANFLLNNTQGTYLPRVSAGIAYRSWFGADIAQYEALYSVPNEPRDIDKKGLRDPVCAACHATLDPLAYAYAYYYGAGSGANFGAYGRDRPEVYLGGLGATREIMDDWYNDPPVPHLFGVGYDQEYNLPAETSSLVLLAADAAQSELFARHITRLVFNEVVGGDPEPRDSEEFTKLWSDFRDQGHSVDKMCHALIDTRAFGGSV